MSLYKILSKNLTPSAHYGPILLPGIIISTKLNVYNYLRKLCVKFSWKWPLGSGEEEKIAKSYANDNDYANNDYVDDGQILSLRLRWTKIGQTVLNEQTTIGSLSINSNKVIYKDIII